MASEFVVQLRIVHEATGTIVAWTPRKPETDGPVIDELCARIAAKGVGVGKSEAHVLADVRAAWHELLHGLKAHV